MMRRFGFILCLLALCSGLSGSEFHIGVYLYDYSMTRTAQGYGKDPMQFAEEHFRILSQNGVNTLHLSVNNRDNFEKIFLPLLKKYQMKAILQLDFAYFRSETVWTEANENVRAKEAGQFIAAHQQDPEILGFSVREEVAQKDVHTLARYYQKILEYAPGAKLAIVHSNLGAARDMPVPDPAIFGTDRYAFWWEFSGNGYIASPAFSLNWLREQAANFYQEAAARGSDFIFVVTQGGWVFVTDDLAGTVGRILKNAPSSEKEKFAQRLKEYAVKKQNGWNEFEYEGKKLYTCWKYYRLPANCLKATAWLAVMEGARYFLCWSYSPTPKELSGTTLETVARQAWEQKRKNKPYTDFGYYTLAGRPGKPNPQLAELAAVAKEIRNFESLIMRMNKLPQSPVTTDNKKKDFNRAFTISGYNGKIIVIHNADVGNWAYDSKYFFDAKDPISIDEEGQLSGYIPNTKPRTIRFKVQLKPGEKVFSFADKAELTAAADNLYSVSILPGSGTLIFVGGNDEFNKLKESVSNQK